MTNQSVEPESRHWPAAWAWMCFFSLALIWGSVTLISSSSALEGGSLKDWGSGEKVKKINNLLHLPFQSAINTWNASIRYRLLGDLGPQVTLGCPDWLFFTAGLSPQRAAENFLQHRMNLIKHWSAQLKQSNIELLVVTVPDKSRIEANHLCGVRPAESTKASLYQWHERMLQEHIATVDLETAFNQSTVPKYFRTDVHLNMHGAALAAQAVGQAAMLHLGEKGSQQFKVIESGETIARMGDLIVLAGLEHASPKWRPPLDQVVSEDIQVIRTAGLLDDSPVVEVLVAGSSNSLRSHFAERLGMSIGREVWNLSLDGSNFSGSIQAAFKNRKQWPASIKLVILEFSESSLTLPLTQYEESILMRMQ